MQPFSFHAYLAAAVDVGRFRAAVDEIGLELIAVDDSSPEMTLRIGTRRTELPEMQFLVERNRPNPQMLLTYLDESAVRSIEPHTLFAWLGGISEGARVRLGRSHQGGGRGLVQERELRGQIECLEWFNFIDQSAAITLGASLSQEAFWAFRQYPSGGVAFALSPDPGDFGRQLRTAESRVLRAPHPPTP